MIYSEGKTRTYSSSLKNPNILEDLNSLLCKEGAKKPPFTNKEVVINLDSYETERARKTRGDKRQTMDFCMGMQCSKILLVEAKLNVNNPSKLKKTDLDGKSNYSKSIFNDLGINISNHLVFLVSDKNAAQCKSHIKRIYSGSPNVKTLTVTEFYAEYF